MKWSTVQQQFPQQWLLVEAFQAHSESGQRIVEEVSVINTFPNSSTALREYVTLHRQAPERELYVLHTEREELNIKE